MAARNQIERRKVITMRWWRSGKGKIRKEHEEVLWERADERISEMMAQGFTSGELSDNIHMTDNNPEDGVEYSGWWEVATQD